MRSAPISALILACLSLAAVDSAAQDEVDFSDELLDPELEPDEALILIKINDKTGNPMPGVVIAVESDFGRSSFTQVSDQTGTILLVIPIKNTYVIKFLSISGENKGHEERFEIDGSSEQRYSLTMTYEPTVTKKYVLDGVTFHNGKATLKKSSYEKLDPLVDYMKAKPTIHVELSGHTDNVGDDEKNITLSEERAKAVKGYLVKKGIDEGRITTTGYGAMHPIASNDTAEGRKKNRRTEVKIID